jgi:putative ABC transport system substrate-binding protein
MRRLSRRAFVGALAALAAYRSSLFEAQSVYAQQPTVPRHIGFLLVGFPREGNEVHQFRQGLQDAGYTEGRDVIVDWRSVDDNFARLTELATELVQDKVDVIVVDSTLGAQAVKRATSTIPIVMIAVADPVQAGLVASYAHPGGNLTGLSNVATELNAKRLQLLKKAIPRLSRVAALWNPDTPYPRMIDDLKMVAPSLSIELSFVSARTSAEFGPAFSAISQMRAQALYLVGDPLFFSHRRTLVQLALKRKLPAIYWQRNFIDEGGLMSYGPSLADLTRRSAGYVDRILKGAKPADLPIEQPTKFEFVVNLKTARALRLTIPEVVLLEADEVIR